LIIIKNPIELFNICKDINNKGFVPTMGALHKGHISLIKKSVIDNKITIVSIFANPTQFLENEDFSEYPKQEKKDIEICKKENVDILFMPQINDMYGNDEPIVRANNITSYILDGFKRPSHFDGVLSVLLKLFNLVKPQNAYFGKKDAQQVLLTEKMVKSFFLDINIIKCETIREENGIAMSSRNIYLDDESKKELLKVSSSLFQSQKFILNGETKSSEIISLIKNNLVNIDVNYIHIINKAFEKCNYVKISKSIILISINIKNINYIDNIWI
jgi:pantoate--beta-alanine ligase